MQTTSNPAQARSLKEMAAVAPTDPSFLKYLRDNSFPEVILLSEAFRDPTYSRPISEGRVNKLLSNYVRGLTVIYVSLRSNGYAIIDGNHRVEAERRLGVTHRLARVFVDLTLAQEADLYLKLNEYWAQTALTRFHAKLTAGDPAATRICTILGKYDLHVSRNPGGERRGITAVATVERIYAERGPEVLDAVCGILHATWGHEPRAWVTSMIDGMHMFYVRYKDVADWAAFSERLKLLTPETVLAQSMSLDTQMHSMSGGVRVGRTLHAYYNKFRRTNKLPEWTSSQGLGGARRAIARRTETHAPLPDITTV